MAHQNLKVSVRLRLGASAAISTAYWVVWAFSFVLPASAINRLINLISMCITEKLVVVKRAE